MSYRLLAASPDSDVSELGESESCPEALAERNLRIGRSIYSAIPGLERIEGSDGTVELTSEELEVLLYGDHATLEVPFDESVDEEILIERLRNCVAVFHEEAGWELYDEQLEQFVDLEEDRPEILAGFRAGVRFNDDYDD